MILLQSEIESLILFGTDGSTETVMSDAFVADKGQVLFQPGQPCPGFVLLNEGSIKVSLTGQSGREVVLYRVRPGQVCLQTLSCLINDEAYGAEGVAETALSGVIVPKFEFQAKMATDETFRNNILSSIAQRFEEYQQLVEDVALTNFDVRLAKALLRLASEDGFVPATHHDLAAETASGRAYVTRRLAEFVRNGWVEQRSNGIVVLNFGRLRQISEGLR